MKEVVGRTLHFLNSNHEPFLFHNPPPPTFHRSRVEQFWWQWHSSPNLINSLRNFCWFVVQSIYIGIYRWADDRHWLIEARVLGCSEVKYGLDKCFCCKDIRIHSKQQWTERQLTDIDKRDLHGLQIGFHAIDFSADWKLVWNTKYLHQVWLLYWS